MIRILFHACHSSEMGRTRKGGERRESRLVKEEISDSRRDHDAASDHDGDQDRDVKGKTIQRVY